MRPQRIFTLITTCFLFFNFLTAQDQLIFQESFSEPSLPASWGIENQVGNEAIWTWTEDGRAPNGNYWNDRPAIGSNSGGGAYMMDSDGQFSDATIAAPFPHGSTLITPAIDCSGFEEVWLQFYQYYRSGMTTTKVGVSNDDGLSWTDIEVNAEIGFAVETVNNSIVKLNVSSIAGGSPKVKLRFIFEGSNYFWIIDDINLIAPDPNNPNNPEFPKTYPTELGDSLTAWNIPYHIDSLGGAYPPNELVVRWVEGLSDVEKQMVRDDLGVIDYDTCSCSEMELFIFPNTLSLADSLNLVENGDFSDGNTGFSSGLVEDCSCISTSYCIGTSFADKCATWNSENFQEFSDPGNGQFLIIDGAAFSATDVWCQDNIDLENGENYFFTFRGRSGSSDNLPVLKLNIRDLSNQYDGGSATVSGYGEWQSITFGFVHTAPSGNYKVCLEQTNAGSNGFDYGIDDLFMANLDAASLTYQDSIEEKQDKGDSMPAEIEEIEFNYYNFDIEELKDTLPVVTNPFPTNENTPSGQDDDMVIAILDTGVDYNYFHNSPGNVLGTFDISPFMWQNPNFTTCYEGDHEGWNFVHFNDTNKRDKPFDDHGHGTHVAGILIKQWLQFSQLSEVGACCQLRVLPVKTHDFHGLGKLFDVSCGIVYAAEMGADVINASWGFTAVQDPDSSILHYAIDRANEDGKRVLIVTSAGNTGTNIDFPVGAPETPNYPSNYNLANIVTVAAMDSAENRWTHTNYSPTTVHYAAPGANIPSIVPEGTVGSDPTKIWAEKSGTSMAAPVVSAYAGVLFCLQNGDGMPLNDFDVKVKLNEFGVPITATDWSSFTITGKKMDPSTFLAQIDFMNCITTTSEVFSPEAEVRVFPNPAVSEARLLIQENRVPVIGLNLTNALGQSVWQQALEQNSGLIDVSLDLQRLPKGLYYISIITEKGTQGIPIIKQ